jgi:metallophosphoesterase (TIGR00282 family)
VGVLNLQGRTHLPSTDCPFRQGHSEIQRLRRETPIIFVDFHAEATAEKIAMGWYLDGLASAVIGTHTHVQTADERVLPNGTAYITDVGMTGPHDSVIGVHTRAALQRFLDGMPARFETATGDPRLNAVLVTADAATGAARGIERLSLSARDVEAQAAGPEAS